MKTRLFQLIFLTKEEEAEMTRYQEEMLSRVMELHQIAKGGMISNWELYYKMYENVNL